MMAVVQLLRCNNAINNEIYNLNQLEPFFFFFLHDSVYICRQNKRIIQNTMLHIGQMIKDKFDQQPKTHTINWFAGQLHCQRGNIYDIFKRATIDIELLIRISRILNHDFFSDISEYIGQQIDAESGDTP